VEGGEYRGSGDIRHKKPRINGVFLFASNNNYSASLTFLAAGPLSPLTTSNVTEAPS